MEKNSANNEYNKSNETKREITQFNSAFFVYKLSIIGFEDFIDIRAFENLIPPGPFAYLLDTIGCTFRRETFPYWRITMKNNKMKKLVRYDIRFQIWFVKVTHYNYNDFGIFLHGSKGVAILLDMQKDFSIKRVIDFIRSRPIKPFSPVLIIVFDKRKHDEMSKALEFKAKFKEDWKILEKDKQIDFIFLEERKPELFNKKMYDIAFTAYLKNPIPII